MAYTEGARGMLEYFVPKGTTPLGREDLAAAAAVHGGLICVKHCYVWRVCFAIDEAVAGDNTAPVVEFNRRPTVGSSSGEVLIDQLTFSDGDAVGTVKYADPTPVEFAVGEELSLEHVTQAADSGTAAGQGYYFVLCSDSPEQDANESNMSESA